MSDGPQARRCYRCGELKPADDFAWRRKRKSQRDSFCRPCRSAYGREHYLANKQRYIDQAAASKRGLRQARTQYLLEYFTTHPCCECGETDPVVLEFDHRDPDAKAFTIGAALSYRKWQAILDEIEKCDVVCANCHRRRHYQGSIRAMLAAEAARTTRAGDRARTGDATLEGSSVTTTPRPRGYGASLVPGRVASCSSPSSSGSLW